MLARFVRLLVLTVLLSGVFVAASGGGVASAHQSGCHRWHSCPSDSGSYVCGDGGYACQYPGGGTTTTPPPKTDYDCADFSSQQAAQSHFNGDTTDPSNLDDDDDNLACEDLPCPCSPEHPRADPDYDGVQNANDACPTVYGRAATAGCPDGDYDGVADGADACPTTFGVVESGGCPKPPAVAVPGTTGASCDDGLSELERLKSAIASAKRKLKKATTKSARKKYAAKVSRLRGERQTLLEALVDADCV